MSGDLRYSLYQGRILFPHRPNPYEKEFAMSKYYVQSGTLKMVVHSASEDRAALWAVHQVLAQVLPVFFPGSNSRAY